jgi:hypothetical protein
MYFLYLLHLFYISTQSVFGTGEVISDESMLRLSVVKRPGEDIKFPLCPAAPGSGSREKWLLSFFLPGSYRSQGRRTEVITLRQCCNIPSLPILIGAGYWLSLLMLQSCIDLS